MDLIVSAQTLMRIRPLKPFVEKTLFNGLSYGLSPAGYDIRVRELLSIFPGQFKLASSIEEFDMPSNLLGVVHDKSTWARQGIAVQNTVIEPGWKGFLTLELTNHGTDVVTIESGTPIAQVIFHMLDFDTIRPYTGKYQNQPNEPVEAYFEFD